MSKSLDDKKYQVWITSYPLNADDPSSKYDPGYELSGTFETITEAVECYRRVADFSPIITKVVTWKEEITDVTLNY